MQNEEIEVRKLLTSIDTAHKDFRERLVPRWREEYLKDYPESEFLEGYTHGPRDTVFFAAQTLFEESSQGSNQAGSDTEIDTLYNVRELRGFEATCKGLIALCEAMLD